MSENGQETYITLVDRSNGNTYELYVSDGKLTMADGEGGSATEFVLLDSSTGTSYEVYADDGKLTMAEGVSVAGAKYVISIATLTEIGDALRLKEGSSDPIPVTSIAQRITDMQSGSDTSDATATESDVLDGETFYANGEKKTGSIPRHTVDNNSVEWAITSMMPGSEEAETSVTIPAGYYEEGSYPTSPLAVRFPSDITPGTSDITVQGGAWFTNNFKVKGDANLVPDNIKAGVSVFDTTGTFTSDATASAGDILKGETAYVNGSKVTGSMKSIGAATIMPGTESQYIDPGVYISGTQTIKGDSSLVADNIKKGVSIFGVSGTLDEVNLDTELAAQESLLYQIESALTAKGV